MQLPESDGILALLCDTFEEHLYASGIVGPFTPEEFLEWYQMQSGYVVNGRTFSQLARIRLQAESSPLFRSPTP